MIASFGSSDNRCLSTNSSRLPKLASPVTSHCGSAGHHPADDVTNVHEACRSKALNPRFVAADYSCSYWVLKSAPHHGMR